MSQVSTSQAVGSRATKVVHIMTSALTISFLANHLRRIDGEGVDYHVAANFNGTRFDADGTNFHQVGLTRSLFAPADLKALWQIVVVLLKIRPDTIIVSTPKAAFLGSMLAFLIFPFRPRILLIRGYRYPTLSGMRRKIVKFMEVFPAVLCTRVLTTSKQSGEMLMEQLPKRFYKKVETVLNGTGNGIDIDRFSPENPEIGSADAVRARFGVEPEHILLTFVGRVCIDKGMEELTTAAETVMAKHPHIRLLVVGEDDPSNALSPEALAKLNALAIRPGRIENPLMPEIYRATDIFLFPSRREGFGVAAIEAAAMGTPTIAARVGGLQSAVREDVSGLFFEPRSAEDLARQIDALVSDKDRLATLSASCRPYVVSHYDERLYDAFWLKIYKRSV